MNKISKIRKVLSWVPILGVVIEMGSIFLMKENYLSKLNGHTFRFVFSSIYHSIFTTIGLIIM